MSILLVQHGEAKGKAEDPERSLTEVGIRNTKKMAAWLSKQGIDIAEIQHSGKKRAAQTADIFANRLAPSRGVNAVPGLNPNDDVVSYAKQISLNGETILVVGHLPFIAKMASFLLSGNSEKSIVSFVNSGVVCLEHVGAGWSVNWAVTPVMLFD